MALRSLNNPIASFIDYLAKTGTDAYGPAGPFSGLTATGGVISDYTDGSTVYRAHIFTSSGTFDVTELGNFDNTVEYLVVAGGGGGGGNPTDGGGGGGAGGFRTNVSGHPLAGSAFPVSTSPGSYTVTIGGGGVALTQGNPSVFGPITSTGGGRGGLVYSDYGGAGGSGGGAGIQNPSGGALIPASTGVGNSPPTSPPQGNPGGGSRHNPGIAGAAGGGGGAGGVGGDAPANNIGGNGGPGSQVFIAGPPATTQPVGTPGPNPGGGYFAGGGGGMSSSGPGAGNQGGVGGGGAGVNGTGNGTPGTYATGGGGGSSRVGTSGSGGSGIVVVRYQIAQLTATAKATGGSVSYYNDKTIHIFTSSGTFTAPGTFNETVEYVVVAGGGGGGGESVGSGGGGAGGYITSSTPLSGPQAISIQVGAGGAQRVSGTNSFFGAPITSTGGGRGASYAVSSALTGGSGGGGSGGDPAPPTNTGAAGTPGQGNPGGNGGAFCAPAGGGGGAGGAGTSGVQPGCGTPASITPGGIGVQIPATFRSPSSSVGAPGPGGGGYWVAGGGAGSNYAGVGQGKGGGPGGPYAGGGNGGVAPQPGQPFPATAATSGLENTGGGGGGGAAPGLPVSSIGGSGGSGIVLIAYPS